MFKLVYANDGVSSYDELFLKSFRERYEVYLFTFHPSPNYVPEGVKILKMKDFIPKTNLHPFEGMRKHFLTQLRAQTLKKNLDKVKPDVLVGCWASTYGFYSAYSNFHPLILLVWGSDVLVFPKKYFPLKPFIVYSIRKADIVVVDSEVQRQAVINLGCEPSKIVKFPWVNLNGFKRDEKQRSRIRRECGWKEDDIIVISLRHHKPIYGVQYLIDAIPHVIAENEKVKFLILGEGPLTSTFKTKMAKFIKSRHVKFVGTVPHNKITEYLSAADIYVSTSFSDGASASLLEAMACSLTPIVTAIPGNLEWIKEGVNGVLVQPADSKKLAEKILLLTADSELRARLQVNAELTIKRTVNWKGNTQKFFEIIEEKLLKK